MLKQLLGGLTTQPVIGVDLGSSLIKAVEVEQAGDQVLLRRCAFAMVQGSDLRGALQRLVTAGDFHGSDVVLGVAAPEVVVRPFLFPPMPRPELEQALALEAEQAVLNGHDPRDMAVDWHLFPTADRGDAMRGLLAVVPKPVMQRRLQLTKAAGLSAVVVDVEALALWNAYWALLGRRTYSSNTVLLVNIGARTTNLVIAQGPDRLMLVRDLQLGALALEQDRAQEWLTEVGDSLGYARATGGLRTLDTAYVTGGGGNAETARLVASILTAPVHCWNPLDYLVCDKQSPTIKHDAGMLLAVAVGLALRQPA